MNSLHELLKRAIVRENRDPRETFDAYFGQCRAMFRFCGKPASEWTGKDVEEYIWQVLHKGNYSRSSRKNYLCAMAFVFKHIRNADMFITPLAAGRVNLLKGTCS